MPTEAQMLEAQKEDPCRQNIRAMVGIEPTWVYSETGLLYSMLSADGSIQIIVPLKYLVAILYNAHYAKLAGHPVVRMMNDSMSSQYYWLYMPSDEHTFVFHCQSSRRHQTSGKHQTLLKVFPPSGPLKRIAIDILGLIMRTNQGQRFIAVSSIGTTEAHRDWHSQFTYADKPGKRVHLGNDRLF